jgi:hypothetical protein
MADFSVRLCFGLALFKVFLRGLCEAMRVEDEGVRRPRDGGDDSAGFLDLFGPGRNDLQKDKTADVAGMTCRLVLCEMIRSFGMGGGNWYSYQ